MSTPTRSAILESNDLNSVKVPVPEWGEEDCCVWVRTLTASERDGFESSMIEQRGGKSKATTLQNIRARFAVLTVVDEEGKRIFDDNDAEELGKKSAQVVDRLFSAAQKQNGMSAEDVEEIAGN